MDFRDILFNICNTYFFLLYKTIFLIISFRKKKYIILVKYNVTCSESLLYNILLRRKAWQKCYLKLQKISKKKKKEEIVI